MARKPHKYHYIYKIICNVTGKYYIGMHSCSNLEDGYMGSGVKIRRSLNKYGIENHTKEILEFLNDRETLKKREFEIINEELIQDPLCMNLQLGGGGGFSSKEHRIKFIIGTRIGGTKGGSIHKQKLINDPEYKIKVSNRSRESMKKTHSEGKFKNNWTDKLHTEETKKKMSESSKGKGIKEDNSQFGTCWITNGIENKKIKKDEQIPDGWKSGRKLK